jgi:hypothetical protein
MLDAVVFGFCFCCKVLSKFKNPENDPGRVDLKFTLDRVYLFRHQSSMYNSFLSVSFLPGTCPFNNL